MNNEDFDNGIKDLLSAEDSTNNERTEPVKAIKRETNTPNPFKHKRTEIPIWLITTIRGISGIVAILLLIRFALNIVSR